MRRIIHNTTAIAACLSLMVPSFAQAQTAADQAEGQVPPPAEQTEAAPAAEGAETPAPEQAPVEAAGAADAESEEAAPADEPAEEPTADDAAPAQPAAEAPPASEPEAADEAEAAPEAGESATPDPSAAEAEAPVEPAAVGDSRPAEAAREQTEERPAERPLTDAPEQKAERAAERNERQSVQEEAVREGQAERPEPAAREQQAERPAEPAREQTQERPAERPADKARVKADTPAEKPRTSDDEQARTPDTENDLRDALAREQQPAGDAPATQPAPTEAAQQAAQETGGAAAAALNDDQQGEVTEQQITEENSRSSSEDFSTSLRDALAPAAGQQPEQAASRDDGDDDHTLAKALLLGLGAVAVGSYLNNDRQVALSAPDRVVVTRPDGSQELIKDEVALLRQPGSTVATENFDDGSSRTIVTREDGSRVVTIRDADLRVLRRTLVSPDGTQTRLIDDTAEVEPVDIAALPAPAPAQTPGAYQDEAALREALRRQADVDRRFTLGQIRNIPEVRALVPQINIDAITFDTGSAAITPDQARQLSALGRVIQQSIAENPREVFLIEGHTDTVGSDAANLALSDRRAESVALALSEYFDVPPENLVVQGYGEQFPQVRREGDVRENRRAAVRRITGLLQTAEAQ